MKKSNKLISLILAVVMVFTATSLTAAAAAIPASANNIEALLKNDNLASLVEWLLDNLNGAKDNITGTVLRLVFNFVDDDALNKEIAGRDVTKLSDEDAAKILLDWLDHSILPDLGSSLPDIVSDIAGALPGVTVDLGSVDGVLGTVVSVCKIANGIINVGIANDLNGEALKNVKRSGGDLNVVKALLKWLDDNSGIVAKAVKGNLDIGIIGNFVDVSEYEDLIKEINVFAKSYIYLLIDGHADAGKFEKGKMAGDWGNSAYKNYTADEMLAAALIRLINDNDEVVSQAECDEALKLSFYGLLAKYGKTLYTRFAVSLLNNDLKDFLKQLEAFEDTKAIFNYDYNFTDASFDDAFKDADATGFLGQLNNILCTILKTMLSADVYAAVAPVEGSNDNLNENLAKACRYVLPILANHSEELGFDFTKFTADAVKDMDLSEMAVAVLKIFFPGWFRANYNADLVNNAETIAQLGVDALYFVVTNKEWVVLDNGFDVSEFLAQITPATIGTLTDAQCVDLLVGIGAKLGAYTLDYVKETTHFELDKTASKDWTWEEYCDEIVDWGIGFIKGLPAVMVKAGISAKRGELDGFGPFYKVNVALNELINFSFLSNVGDETFALDTETLIFDTILGNAFKFDFKAIVDVFAKNNNAGNLFNAPNTVISATISFVDRILTALFAHTCGATADFTKEDSCTADLKGKYDKNNGHYVGTVSKAEVDHHNFVEDTDKRIEATCQDGTAFYTCTKCGETKEETLKASGEHQYVVKSSTATCGQMGEITYECTVCGDTYNEIDILEHNFVDGVCTICGAKEGEEPAGAPANLADVNGDGNIAADDARAALRASVGLDAIEEGSDAFLAADVNGDGKIGADDARTILRISVNLDKIDDVKAAYGA